MARLLRARQSETLLPSICLLGIHQITTGMLQGMGQTIIPMWNMLFSALVKAAAVWYLTALPCNIVGAAWASNINFGLAAALNIFFLIRSGITFKVYALGKNITGGSFDGSSQYAFIQLFNSLLGQYFCDGGNDFCSWHRLSIDFDSKRNDRQERIAETACDRFQIQVKGW